jgi:inosose dehydratase
MKVSCAMLTWGKEFEKAVVEASELGYRGCEAFNRIPMQYEDKVDEFKALLAENELTLSSLYVEGYLTDIEKRQELVDYSERVAKFLVANGCDNLVLGPSYRPAGGPTAEQLKIAAETINQIAQKCADLGVKLSVHPHLGTEIQNEDEMDAIMEMTDNNNVFLCPDTAQLAKAGMDVVQVLHRYKDRIGYVHLKDLKENVNEPFEYGKEAVFFTEMGRGTINFVPIIDCLKEINYQGWLAIEVDSPNVGTPKESLTICRDYIENVLGIRIQGQKVS